MQTCVIFFFCEVAYSLHNLILAVCCQFRFSSSNSTSKRGLKWDWHIANCSYFKNYKFTFYIKFILHKCLRLCQYHFNANWRIQIVCRFRDELQILTQSHAHESTFLNNESIRKLMQRLKIKLKSFLKQLCWCYGLFYHSLKPLSIVHNFFFHVTNWLLTVQRELKLLQYRELDLAICGTISVYPNDKNKYGIQ